MIYLAAQDVLSPPSNEDIKIFRGLNTGLLDTYSKRDDEKAQYIIKELNKTSNELSSYFAHSILQNNRLLVQSIAPDGTIVEVHVNEG
jgi:hypothetical protein